MAKNPLTGMVIPLGIIPQMVMKNRSDKRKAAAEEGAAFNVSSMKMAKGGKVGRGDGCCMKGKTKGKMC